MQLKPQKSFEYEGDSGLKRFKILYLQSSYMWNMYVLINKSQLNNDVNSQVHFPLQIP